MTPKHASVTIVESPRRSATRVSADGTTWTVTTTGLDSQGQKVNDAAVFVRQ